MILASLFWILSLLMAMLIILIVANVLYWLKEKGADLYYSFKVLLRSI